MRIDLLTREYPPHVYGGAGVHVAELATVLREHVDLHVHCFDGPRHSAEPGVHGYAELSELAGANSALRTFGVDLAMAAGLEGTELLHSHTWYANLAGHLGALLHDVPHVVSAHSLEPLRPWKAEQLGGGYALSSWAERIAFTAAEAVIAVSAAMRDDILRVYSELDPATVHVVHNGIDLETWQPPPRAEAEQRARQLGLDPQRPAVIFVGRITRQKGLPHLLRAAHGLPDDVQVVLCAGAPDTAVLAEEVQGGVASLREHRSGVVWISEMLEHDDLLALLSCSTVFCCPSVYEPLGIVNLEAMALGLPVVATATGGIPEVVVDGVTGRLVPIEQVADGSGTPLDAEGFAAELHEALAEVLADPAAGARMGQAGRRRAAEHFSWQTIGQATHEIYRRLS